jgi:lysylphosphatidylglycerol synthetase-like protein (DUF2156 family)
MASAFKDIAVDVAKSGLKAKVTAAAAGEKTSFRQHATTAATAHATSHATSLGKAAGKKYIDAYIAIPRLIVRALQLILAIIAAGVYGARLSAERNSTDKDASVSPEWIFATAVAATASITAALFALSTPLALLSSRLETYKAFTWDLFLALMWVIVFGVFAGIFIKRTDEDGEYKGASTGTMKAVLWVDMVSAILWIGSGLYGALRKFASEKVGQVGEKVGGKVVGKLFGPAKAAPETSQV